MSTKVIFQLIGIVYGTVFEFAPMALTVDFFKIGIRGLGADGYVYFLLHQNIIGDLVVISTGLQICFKVFLRKDVMHIAFVQEDIGNGDVP
jgi:hypothetical protein